MQYDSKKNYGIIIFAQNNAVNHRSSILHDMVQNIFEYNNVGVKLFHVTQEKRLKITDKNRGFMNSNFYYYNMCHLVGPPFCAYKQ